MKEHIQRDMINELRDIATKYYAHQCLRELISSCVSEHLQRDAEWVDKPKPRPERIFVIAGNYQQYQHWCHAHDLNIKQFLYVSHRHQLLGMRGAKYILIGTFVDNPAYNPIDLSVADMKLTTLDKVLEQQNDDKKATHSGQEQGGEVSTNP